MATTVAGWAAPSLLRAQLLRGVAGAGVAGQGRPASVALTFDDGPDPEGTPRVLDVLDRLGWTATFFMLGAQVQQHPEIAARVAAAGHEVAVHGFTHRNHLTRGTSDVCRDAARAAEVIAAVTGVQPTWFRPPYGVLTMGSLTAARRTGLRPVLWTAWGRDWEASSPARVAATVGHQLRPGGTVLLHDSDCTAQVTGSWRSTVGALPRLAELAERLGCTVGPLRDHLPMTGQAAGSGRPGIAVGNGMVASRSKEFQHD